MDETVTPRRCYTPWVTLHFASGPLHPMKSCPQGGLDETVIQASTFSSTWSKDSRQYSRLDRVVRSSLLEEAIFQDMPSSRSFFHKNRSQGSLLNTQESTGRRSHQASPIDSPLHSPRFPPSSVDSPESKDDSEEFRFGQPSVYRPDQGRYYQASNIPARSHSQRSPPANPSYHQPTINLVGPPAGSPDPPVIDEDPDAYYTQPLTQTAPREDSKRRRFFKLGSSSSAKEPQTNPPPANRLGRSLSVRKKELDLQGDVKVQGVAQQRRPSKLPSLALPPDQGTVEEQQAEAVARRSEPNSAGPPPPEKDPLRSPRNFPPQQTEHSYSKTLVQGVNTNLPQRPEYERQASTTSSIWENTARSLQHPRAPSENFQQSSPYQASPSSAVSNQTPQSYQASPSSATSISSHQLQPRGAQEVIQQYRHEIQRERPASQQSSYEPPSPVHPAHRGPDHPYERQGSNRSSLNAYTPSAMGPPPPPQQQARGRHSDEMDQRNPHGPPTRENSAYQPYQQQGQGQSQPSNGQGQYGPQLGISQQNQAYRGAPQPSPLPNQTLNESGRNTPPPSRSRDDLTNLDVSQLLARHDELRQWSPFIIIPPNGM